MPIINNNKIKTQYLKDTWTHKMNTSIATLSHDYVIIFSIWVWFWSSKKYQHLDKTYRTPVHVNINTVIIIIFRFCKLPKRLHASLCLGYRGSTTTSTRCQQLHAAWTRRFQEFWHSACRPVWCDWQSPGTHWRRLWC